MSLYANGFKFTHQRQLEQDELAELISRINPTAKRYRKHYKLGRFVLYACFAVILVAGLASFAPVPALDGIAVFIPFFCCLFPPLVASIQEIVVPSNKWMQGIFGLFYLYLFGSIAINGFVSSEPLMIIVVFALLIAWCAFLLRWFDAKRFHPVFDKALTDIANGVVNSFDDSHCPEPNERSNDIETLPKSHIIYRVKQAVIKTWEFAEVHELADNPTSTNDDLQPWTNTRVTTTDPQIGFYQRPLTTLESQEIVAFRQRLLRDLPIKFLGAFFFSAFAVRLIENFWQGELAPGLSPTAWIIALIFASLYPAFCFNRRRLLGLDLKSNQMISVWHEGDPHDTLLEEFLPNSILSWSANSCPAYWRVN